ncbi:MAG: NUMOD3 domain-containing DNA-binding protein, partial [Methylobacter sp.]
MEERNYLIYKHTSPSGKSYIGQTRNYTMRSVGHRRRAGEGGDGCRAFSAAIRKYGWGNFAHEILREGLTLEEANVLEQKMIAEHNTICPNGYNLATGGKNSKPSKSAIEAQIAAYKSMSEEKKLARGAKISAALTGRKKSEEHRKKLSELRKGAKASDETKAKMSKTMKGRKLTNEHVAKVAAFHTGRKKSEEHRKKLSEAAKNRPDEVNERIAKTLTGRKASGETRAKMSASRLGKRHSDESKLKISLANKGRSLSEDHKAKLS